MQKMHDVMNERAWCRNCGRKKTALLHARRWVWCLQARGIAQAAAQAAVDSGHEYGDKSQQQHQRCAHGRQHHGNHADDVFNRVLAFGFWGVCGHKGLLLVNMDGRILTAVAAFRVDV
jgi:hypothetical protein